jgi:hypothetical protein
MSLHLFATPVQCTHCGTVVDDPKIDRCPQCGAILKERRTPRRLAGVEKRYGNLRFMVGFLRFLAVITFLVGALAFFFGLGYDTQRGPGGILLLMGSVLAAVAMYALAAFFELALDVEENTRASFRVQQMILEHLHDTWPVAEHPAAPAAAPAPPAVPSAGAAAAGQPAA